MDELAFRWAKQRPDESQVEMACRLAGEIRWRVDFLSPSQAEAGSAYSRCPRWVKLHTRRQVAEVPEATIGGVPGKATTRCPVGADGEDARRSVPVATGLTLFTDQDRSYPCSSSLEGIA
jgi:hypothetical protein